MTMPKGWKLDFWSKVDKSAGPEGCWSWTGYRNKSRLAYGVLRTNNKNIPAHRFAWGLVNGPIPDGLIVCHKCDNPSCCNPSHLFLGTFVDNMQDAKSKGRTAKGSRHGLSKLTEPVVVEIKRELASGISKYALARKYGVSETTIRKIAKRLTWLHV